MASVVTASDLAEAKAAELREWITSGRFRPGQQLGEHDLSRGLEVSRNTVRESVRILMHDGLLVRRPHRGVFVADVTVGSIVDLYRIRRIIQPPVLAGCAPVGHPAMDRAGAALAAADAAVAAGQWTAVGTANMEFHRALMSLSDSPRLMDYFDRLVAEVRLIFVAIDDPRRVHAPFVARNRTLYDLLAKDLPQEAALALENYLEYSERTIIGSFARKELAGVPAHQPFSMPGAGR